MNDSFYLFNTKRHFTYSKRIKKSTPSYFILILLQLDSYNLEIIIQILHKLIVFI